MSELWVVVMIESSHEDPIMEVVSGFKSDKEAEDWAVWHTLTCERIGWTYHVTKTVDRNQIPVR